MKLLHYLQLIKQQKRELFLVAFLLITAYVLRIYRIEERLLWHADTAHDALVARHIARYDEILLLGHTAYGLRISGNRDVFDPTRQGHYPTDYYYFLALFWRLSDDVFTVARLVTVWQVLGLAILYLGVRKALNVRAALTTLVVCSVSTASILHAQTVGTIQMSLPLLFMSFTLTVSALKEKSPALLLLAALTAIAITAFHYAGVLCAGIVFLVGVRWMPSLSKRQRLLLGGALLAIIFGGFSAIHVQLVQYFGWEAVKTSFLTFSQSGNTLQESFTQLYLAIEFRLTHFYPNFPWVFSIGSGILAAIAYWQSDKTTRNLLQFCLGCIASLCLAVLTRDRDVFHFEQIMYIDYAYLTLLSISLSVLLSHGQKTYQSLGGVFIFVFGLALSRYLTFQPNTQLFVPIQSARTQAEAIVRTITDLDQRMVIVSSYYSPDWESSTVVFWLEKITGQKLVSLRNTYNNYDWSQEQKHRGVFLCQRLKSDKPLEQNACQYFLSRALQRYGQRVQRQIPSTPFYHGYLVSK